MGERAAAGKSEFNIDWCGGSAWVFLRSPIRASGIVPDRAHWRSVREMSQMMGDRGRAAVLCSG